MPQARPVRPALPSPIRFWGLLAIWLLSPLLLLVDPTLFGMLTPPQDFGSFMSNVALIWLAVAVGGIVFRAVQLFLSGVGCEDHHGPLPQHPHLLQSAYYLLRGQLFDPMQETEHERPA